MIAFAFLLIGSDCPGLSLGVLAAIVLKDRNWHLSRRGTAALVLLAVASVPFLIVPATYMRAAPFFGLAVVLLLARRGRPLPVATIFGGMSYPLYLNHWVGIFAGNAAASRFDPPGPMHTVITVGVGVSLACVHYFAIDSVIRRRRAAWYSPRAGVVAMSCAYTIFAIGMAYGFMTVGRIV